MPPHYIGFIHTYSNPDYSDLRFVSASDDGAFLVCLDNFYEKKIVLIHEVNDEFFFEDVSL